MAQKPLSEMADRGYANGSEETGYILHEFKAFAAAVSTKIEQAATAQDLQAIWRSCEHLFASKSETTSAIQVLANKIEGLDDLKSNLMAVISALEQKATQADLVALSSYVSGEIDRAKTNVVDRTITTAQVKTLNATPFEMLPAPGAGKYIEVIRMEIFLDYATTAYAGDSGKELSLEYSSSGQLISVPATGVFDLSAEQRRCLNHSSTHLVGVDEALILKMTVGELTAGDSPLKVRLDYQIVNVLA